MQNDMMIVDGRVLFRVVWKGFPYILRHPKGKPSFKSDPDDI